MELFVIIAVVIGLLLLWNMRTNTKKTADAAQLQLSHSDQITLPHAAREDLEDFLIRNGSIMMTAGRKIGIPATKQEIKESVKQIYVREVSGSSGVLVDVIVSRIMGDAAKQCHEACEDVPEKAFMWQWRILLAIWQLKHDCLLKTNGDKEFVWRQIMTVDALTKRMLLKLAATQDA